MCKRSILLILASVMLPLSVRAANCDSYFSKAGISTYKYMSIDRKHKLAQNLAQVYEKRSKDEHYKIDQSLTFIHAQREMTFQVKNPATGYYDKFVDVPANSRAVVLDSVHFDSLIQSTGPILRKLREILQLVYSGEPLDMKALGLDQLGPKSQELVRSIIEGSIYLEPELIHENMRDYPFLAVAGFDGAIGDPDNPDPRFFEMNLGTPSGLSNNILLLEALLKLDKDFKKEIGPYLPQDDTFEILRQTIESNAYHWTGVDGLSVVMSPGIYNGAHADVAAISRLTGMPLVNSSDLYADSDGNIRLITKSKPHPIVTGIYGRKEESFFLQNDEIPMISPNNVEMNKKLSKDLGLNLRLAASYKYIRNDEGEVVDIERGKNNEPLYQDVWDKPRLKKTSFVEAIKNKKLYYSAIGGRVVDDKRLFPIVAENMIFDEDKENLAQPVSTLHRTEYDKLYKEPNKYVVKEPNNSGGVGVHFLLELSDQDKEKILSRVKESPGDYEVQELRSPNTILSYFKNRMGRIVSKSVATDIRIFPMMDAEGNVRAGPNSLLFRTGPKNSFFSNTSLGGGYGVVAVTRGEPDESFVFYGYDVPAPSSTDLTKSKLTQFESFMNSLWNVRKTFGRDTNIDLLQNHLRELSFNFRDIMDLLPESVNYLPALLRYYADKETLVAADLKEIENRLHRYLWDLYIVQGKLDSAVADMTHNFFKSHEAELKKNLNYGQNRALKANASEGFVLNYFPQPERIYFWNNEDGSILEKFEVAEFLAADNPKFQALIDELKRGGGELRLNQSVRTDTLGKKIYQSTHGGFWVNHTLSENSSYLKPTISLDISSEPATVKEARRLAVLSHEMEHFRFWRETYEELLRNDATEEDAVKGAYLIIDSDENIVESERRAVTKEMEVEREEAKRLGLESLGPPLEETEFGYINRITYPEFEGLRRLLLKNNKDKAKPLMQRLIEDALHYKTNAIQKLSAKTFLDKIKNLFFKNNQYKQWEKAPLVDLLIFPHGVERLLAEETLFDFVELYEETLADFGLENDLELSEAKKLMSKVNFRNKGRQESEQQQQ